MDSQPLRWSDFGRIASDALTLDDFNNRTTSIEITASPSTARATRGNVRVVCQ
ncbi:hypothetical protein [Nonomuraea angiospora]